MNRLLIPFLTLCLLLFDISPAPAQAADATPIFYRDNIPCPNILTINQANRLFAQARAIADCLGVITEWDEANQQARFWGQIGTRFADLRLYPLFEMTSIHMYNQDGSYIGMANMTYFPIVREGRTYIALRDIIEAFGVRVDWVPTGPSGRPEVRINTAYWPAPTNMSALSPFLRTHDDHFALSIEPEGGWPVPPAQYIGMVNTLSAINLMIDHYRVQEPAFSFGFNEAKGRAEFLIDRQRTDHYATHAVVWMRSEAEAKEYIDGLTPNTWHQRLMNALAGAGVAGAWAHFEIVPWAVPLAVSYVSSETKTMVDERWQSWHTECLNQARRDPNWRTEAKQFEGIFGFVYGDGRVHCVPHFTEAIIGPNGAILE